MTAAVFLGVLIANPSLSQADEGISLFYSRYDVRSAKHSIIDDNLLMIPAKNDFRAEKFSLLSFEGVIKAEPGESKENLEKRIRETTIKTILKRHGLKSVKTKDYETVVSYEGVVKTPLTIIHKSFNTEENTYHYSAQIEFAPIAFPDKWPAKQKKNRIKSLFSDLIDLIL